MGVLAAGGGVAGGGVAVGGAGGRYSSRLMSSACGGAWVLPLLPLLLAGVAGPAGPVPVTVSRPSGAGSAAGRR